MLSEFINYYHYDYFDDENDGNNDHDYDSLWILFTAYFMTRFIPVVCCRLNKSVWNMHREQFIPNLSAVKDFMLYDYICGETERGNADF